MQLAKQQVVTDLVNVLAVTQQLEVPRAIGRITIEDAANQTVVANHQLLVPPAGSIVEGDLLGILAAKESTGRAMTSHFLPICLLLLPKNLEASLPASSGPVLPQPTNAATCALGPPRRACCDAPSSGATGTWSKRLVRATTGNERNGIRGTHCCGPLWPPSLMARVLLGTAPGVIPPAASAAAAATRRHAPACRLGRGARPRRRPLCRHHRPAWSAQCRVLHLRSVADRGLLGLQQAGETADRHQQRREALEETVAAYTPDVVARICGLPMADIIRAGRGFGSAGAALSLYCQGLNQSAHGTHNNAALIHLHLATGQIGHLGAGPFLLTGQPNAMGGREVVGLANLLSAQRDLGATRPGERRAPRRSRPSVGRTVGTRTAGEDRHRAGCRSRDRRGQGGLDRLHQPVAIAAGAGGGSCCPARDGLWRPPGR
ncbi:MAG: Nitrate reductase [Candidatus Accumulibacter sp. BA-94]|nr:MAG: Nitrate reductase [Candidatus Accumulibacter sp. BA-94]